ncbi:hypothetical protein ACQ4PT_058038 [Festuca glaucescens]
MSSPPKRRRRAPRTMETQGAVRTTHQSLPELDAYPANNGSMASSAETNAQTCGDGNICGDAPKTRDGSICGDGNICEGALNTRDCIICGDGNICEGTLKTRDGIICGDGNICEGAPKTRDVVICGDGNTCEGALNLELEKLPEDTIRHIHSLIPVQDAARVACVSRQFLRSWRCYSKLILTKKALGLSDDNSEGSEIRYISKIDKIFNTYSCNGMKIKTLRIDLHLCESVSASYIDRWLHIAVKSGINELSLSLPYSRKKKYYFPYLILFDETATSLLQSLYLVECIFEPIETLGIFRKLKSLDLFFVHITEKGLQLLLSKSSGLERVQIDSCTEIICLKIPCTLQKLKLLIVKACEKIQVVEISAPNLSTFDYNGVPLEICIRDPSQLKHVYLSSYMPSRILSYVSAKLPSIARNVERLTLLSRGENVNTPMLPHKLLHLKSLEIKLHRSGESPIYDIFSVVSFLDASPALESFILHAERDAIIHDCVAWDDLYPRGESAYKHNCLRRVKITGFHSAKSLIKFVIHILESAPSLESLMLDTTHGYGQKAGDASKCTASKRRGKCSFMSVRDIKDANSAVEAAGRYISGRVPSAVEYEVLEPCRRCHTGSQTVDEGWWACLKQRSG